MGLLVDAHRESKFFLGRIVRGGYRDVVVAAGIAASLARSAWAQRSVLDDRFVGQRIIVAAHGAIEAFENGQRTLGTDVGLAASSQDPPVCQVVVGPSQVDDGFTDDRQAGAIEDAASGVQEGWAEDV